MPPRLVAPPHITSASRAPNRSRQLWLDDHAKRSGKDMRYKILITGPELTPKASALAADGGAALIPLPTYTSPEALAEIARSEDIDAIIVRTGKVDEQVIAASPRLKVIAKHGVGYDNIDIAAAGKHRVPVMVARGANSQSVAELALALMFGVARDLSNLDNRIKSGHWDKASHTGLQLFGKSLGIVGLGEIGRILIGLVKPLRMSVRVFDPFIPAGTAIEDAELVGDLNTLLANSDIVSLHCPLTAQTRNMIGPDQLALMPKGSILINTARGGLIDEQALFVALRDGHLAGAGLDTFAQEPPAADTPLLTLPNVIATPHAGASTLAAREAMGVIAVGHILDVLEGRAIDERAFVNRHLIDSAANKNT